MAKRRYKPEEIVIKLRQVEVLQSQGEQQQMQYVKLVKAN